MKKLIATDLDGTLFWPRRRFKNLVAKRNVSFLRKYIDDGGKVVLVSSRSTSFMKEVIKKIDRPMDMVACNSCVIINDEKTVRNIHLDRKIITDIVDEINETYHPKAFLLTSKDHAVVLWPVKSNWFMRLFYRIYYFLQLAYAEKYVISEKIFRDELKNGDVYKIMVFFGLSKKKQRIAKEVNKLLRAKYASIESSWIGVFNEITPLGCSKGQGVEIYCKHANIDADDVMVVGDSGNDIDMFQKFPKNSVCMNHAPVTVKKYASHVVKRYSDLSKFVYDDKGEKNE